MAKAAVKESTFLWQGTNREGMRVKGQMDALSDALVKVQLRKQGVNPISVRKKSELFSKRKKAITTTDIAIFSRQMATMMKAGVPLLQSFDIIAEGFDNPNMRKLIDEVKQEVAAGNSFAGLLLTTDLDSPTVNVDPTLTSSTPNDGDAHVALAPSVARRLEATREGPLPELCALGLVPSAESLALLTEPLEAVRARPRLVRAPAEHRRARRLHRVGGRQDLVARLDRARSRDHREVVAADLAAAFHDEDAVAEVSDAPRKRRRRRSRSRGGAARSE